MANLVWTGVLYFCTFGIVYLIYRLFKFDRQAENISKTQDLINRSYGGKAPAIAEAVMASTIPTAKPGRPTQAQQNLPRFGRNAPKAAAPGPRFGRNGLNPRHS